MHRRPKDIIAARPADATVSEHIPIIRPSLTNTNQRNEDVSLIRVCQIQALLVDTPPKALLCPTRSDKGFSWANRVAAAQRARSEAKPELRRTAKGPFWREAAECGFIR